MTSQTQSAARSGQLTHSQVPKQLCKAMLTRFRRSKLRLCDAPLCFDLRSNAALSARCVHPHPRQPLRPRTKPHIGPSVAYTCRARTHLLPGGREAVCMARNGALRQHQPCQRRRAGRIVRQVQHTPSRAHQGSSIALQPPSPSPAHRPRARHVVIVRSREVGLCVRSLELEQRAVIGTRCVGVGSEVAQEALLGAVPQQGPPLLHLHASSSTREHRC